MKAKINISEILKDKPKGTKLYSPIFGDCTFSFIQGVTDAICVTANDNREFFDYKGLYSPTGECLLFPSRLMRDWSKFTWKRGDVLQKNSHTQVIFDSFVSDTYDVIRCKYFLNVDNGNETCIEETNVFTQDYFKASEEQRQCYINKVEEILGGKLNCETLEIEKTQPEFKDGDIVFMKGIKSGYYANCIFILRSEYKDGDERAFYYAFYNTDDKFTIAEYGNTRVHYSLRPATDSEKQQLFDALAKKGKAWDAEKKAIVNLESVVELKPFDKVLVRDSKSDNWRANLFGYIGKKDGYYHCVYANWAYCIPYTGNESLLGTTKDVEG